MWPFDVEKDDFSILQQKLKDINWFIAGGYAVDKPKATDIDVFFETKEDYDQAVERLELEAFYKSPFAVTAHDMMGKPLQLIHAKIGTPEQVTSSFDLHCSKKAILPDGTVYTNPSFTNKIRVDYDNLSLDTLKRVLKYKRKGFVLHEPTVRKLTEFYITSGKSCKNFYTKKEEPLIGALAKDLDYDYPDLIREVADSSLDEEQRLAFYETYIHPWTEFKPDPKFSPEYHAILASRGVMSDIARKIYPEYCI